MTHSNRYLGRYIGIMRSVEPSKELRQRIINNCLGSQQLSSLPPKPTIAAVSCTVVLLAVGSRILYTRRRRAQ